MWAGLSWSIRGREWGECVQNDFSGPWDSCFSCSGCGQNGAENGQGASSWSHVASLLGQSWAVAEAHTYHLKLRQTGLGSTDLLPGADGGVVERSWLAGALKQVLRGVSFPYCWPSSKILFPAWSSESGAPSKSNALLVAFLCVAARSAPCLGKAWQSTSLCSDCPVWIAGCLQSRQGQFLAHWLTCCS